MPMTALAVGAVAAPVVSGIIGSQQQAGNLANAQNAYQNAFNQYLSVGIPSVQAQQLALQLPEVQGQLTPQMINAQQNMQTTNAMAGIQTDPRLMQAQMNALQQMQQLGQTGLNATDIAALTAAQRQTEGQNQAQQQSILQNLASRGAAGGGLELATRLAASQQAADQAGQQSQNVMSQAQQRMLQAMAQSGQLGAQMQSTQFGQQAAQAQAANAIAAFNAQQQAAAQGANVQASNIAQAQNLANAQAIANQQVATQNAQQEYNSQLMQQNFGNQMALAGARSGALQGLGNMYTNQANRQGQQTAAIGQGIGQLGLGGALMMNNGQNPFTTPSTSTSSEPGVSFQQGMATQAASTDAVNNFLQNYNQNPYATQSTATASNNPQNWTT